MTILARLATRTMELPGRIQEEWLGLTILVRLVTRIMGHPGRIQEEWLGLTILVRQDTQAMGHPGVVIATFKEKYRLALETQDARWENLHTTGKPVHPSPVVAS